MIISQTPLTATVESHSTADDLRNPSPSSSGEAATGACRTKNKKNVCASDTRIWESYAVVLQDFRAIIRASPRNDGKK